MIVVLIINAVLLVIILAAISGLYKRTEELSKLHEIAINQFKLINNFMDSSVFTSETQLKINDLFNDFVTNQTTINAGVGASLKELFSKVNQ